VNYKQSSISNNYLPQYLQTLCDNFVLPQFSHFTKFGRVVSPSLCCNLFPFLWVECFRFGNGAIREMISKGGENGKREVTSWEELEKQSVLLAQEL
jgi:hypothetical protein